MQIQNIHPIHAFVADADNVGLCGQRGCAIDLQRFIAWLRQDRSFDAAESVICTNWLSGMECALLRAIGFVGRFVEAYENCDHAVEEQIVDLVEKKGVRHLYLASGDGGYASLIKRLQKQYGLRVHLICRRSAHSKVLAALCQGITFIDAFAGRAAA